MASSQLPAALVTLVAQLWTPPMQAAVLRRLDLPALPGSLQSLAQM
jgi:hypothetical protein